jgi:hypothetical protein
MGDYVRDSNGIFINSNVFREAAMHFEKYGYYTSALEGSVEWLKFWKEEQRRCIEGYEVSGVKITGHHYNYLNYTRIKAVNFKTGRKVIRFPDFWDGDYNFFWAIEIARNGISQKDFDALKLFIKTDYLQGNKHIIVAKSRRKGYSYKVAAILSNIYNTIRDTTSVISAYEDKYAKDTMLKLMDNLNFYNEHTAWKKGRTVDRADHKRAGYFVLDKDGMPIERGYKSEVTKVTFKDNPDASRGKDAYIQIIDEAGVFGTPGLLKNTLAATQPSFEAGDYLTGFLILFGTSGDLEGGTADFAEIFNNPEEYNFMPFNNVWDSGADKFKVGFFHPMQWNLEGYYDEQGNSDIEAAVKRELTIREGLYQKSKSQALINKRAMEYPMNPAEAFALSNNNDFPVMELKEVLAKMMPEKTYLKKGQAVELYYDDEGKVQANPDLVGSLEPLYEFKNYDKQEGAVVIYEQPMDNPPKYQYIMGYDPYRQDYGSSLGAVIVYKTSVVYTKTHDTIVATYIGRPNTFDEYNRRVAMLAEFYGATILYENEVPAVKSWFLTHKKAHLLESQPDDAIKNVIKHSAVKRVYGMHMNKQLLDTAEKYYKRWLLEERDLDGDGVMKMNLHYIPCPGLIQETIRYSRTVNTDRVSAMFMIMFYLSQLHIERGNSLSKPAYNSISQLKEILNNF